MNYFTDAVFKNYANFSDKLDVQGYWMFFLINLGITMILFVMGLLLFPFLILLWLYALGMLIPGLAAAIRRLKDTGTDWTYIFINLIPLVGFILFIVRLCQPSKPEAVAEVAVTEEY